MKRRFWKFWHRGFPAEIRWFIQRGRRGYSDQDLWSLDCYLASWLPSALRAYGHGGHPSQLTHEQWKTILETMATGFEAHHRMIAECPTREEEVELEKKSRRARRLFAVWFGYLWD